MKKYKWKNKPPSYYANKYKKNKIGWSPFMAKYIGKTCKVVKMWGHKWQCLFPHSTHGFISFILDQKDLELVE